MIDLEQCPLILLHFHLRISPPKYMLVSITLARRNQVDRNRSNAFIESERNLVMRIFCCGRGSWFKSLFLHLKYPFPLFAGVEVAFLVETFQQCVLMEVILLNEPIECTGIPGNFLFSHVLLLVIHIMLAVTFALLINSAILCESIPSSSVHYCCCSWSCQ
jgi:hypothetical protein